MKKLQDLINIHKSIWKDGFVTGVSTGITKKIKIISSYTKNSHGFIKLQYNQIQIIDSTIKLSYETMIPLFSLGGHEVRVLLFIIAYCANKDNGSFIWNHEAVDQYLHYYNSITDKKVSTETVRQAIITLVKHNVLQKQKKNHYVLNPLYASKSNTFKTEHRINDFTKKFIEHGKSIGECLSFK